ncbi:glycosyltransferase family 9 protein [Terriglobus aquaticus]|uniref:Glycosyltransferase family 9 protein n=1 Tax=Terriglobus aquaticus TaxID=940139 RepID=A0ABW9KFM0_9BACT|nr:glycosyltransferase family 9 protein [Terriglobus aquaticus]
MKPFGQTALQRKVDTGTPRFLIVRVGAMGDVIHALPAVAMLREALPQAHIGWAIEPRWLPLLCTEGTAARDPDCMPLVDSVHRVEAKQWNRQPVSLATLRSILALRRELRQQHYDIAIDLQGTLRSAVIARMSGARVVIGSAAPREDLARRFYSKRVPRAATHVVDQAMELVRAAVPAAKITSEMLHTLSGPLLPRDHQAEAEWERRREELCEQRRPVLLAATAGWGAKEWPPEKFAELAAALVNRGECVLLNTPPGQVDAVTQRVLDTVRTRSPAEARHVHAFDATLPMLIAATRCARAVIAGDTGPLHLAEAVGTPALGLFGPTDPARTGPRRDSICLRDATSVTDHRRHAATEAGLARMPVGSVFEAFVSLTQQTRERETRSC